MGSHDGHRERVRKRYKAEGLDSFEEKQALELLLFYVIPRSDTEPIARELLTHFGSLESVLEAPIAALAQVTGMGENAATFLRLVADFNRYQMIHRNNGIKVLRTIQQCAEHIRPHFYGRRDEALCILCLDAQCRILGCKIISEGSVNSTGIPIRKIVEYALSINTTSMVIAHNHPSKNALPSQDDIRATQKLAVALDAMDILLADHLIFAGDDYVSLAESGVFTPIT